MKKCPLQRRYKKLVFFCQSRNQRFSLLKICVMISNHDLPIINEVADLCSSNIGQLSVAVVFWIYFWFNHIFVFIYIFFFLFISFHLTFLVIICIPAESEVTGQIPLPCPNNMSNKVHIYKVVRDSNQEDNMVWTSSVKIVKCFSDSIRWLDNWLDQLVNCTGVTRRAEHMDSLYCCSFSVYSSSEPLRCFLYTSNTQTKVTFTFISLDPVYLLQIKLISNLTIRWNLRLPGRDSPFFFLWQSSFWKHVNV